MADHFQLETIPDLQPRYNVAPTQFVASVRSDGAGGRECVMLHWGLIPSWAQDRAMGNRMINARSDTVAVKPSFRSAFRKRRCLVPMDGFYEWQRAGKQKKPYHIGLADGGPFAVAALWETWERGGDRVHSVALLTTDANETLEPIHDRMPVILDRRDYATWLDPALEHGERLERLLKPYAASEMRAVPVSTWVNNPSHEGPRCTQPDLGLL